MISHASILKSARENLTNNNGPDGNKKFKKSKTGCCYKTIVIAAKFKEMHPIYGKFVQKTKKYHAHDEKNEANVGDTVLIMETRPLSKTKRWRLVQIVEKAK